MTVVVWVWLPSTPVTVSGYEPVAAVPACTDRVDEPPAVTLVGARSAVAPTGTPETVRSTLPALPAVRAVEMLDVAVSPATMVTADGLATMEKSLTTLTGKLWVTGAAGR